MPQFPSVIDLSALTGSAGANPGFRLDGIDAGDSSGRSVASAGDVNGDGFADLIIGALRADPGGDDEAGASYVVFGRASGFATSLDLATLDGTNGFRLDGIDAFDRSGASVASAGDVNGDGFADILIGAYGGDPGGDSDSGESYVVFGKASGFAVSLDLAALDGTNGFRLDGIDADDRSGFSVASAGDVNGDGFGDIMIGAFLADNAAGESYVVFGKASGFAASVDLAALDGTNGFRLDDIDAHDRSGFSVASAGDVNGDGFADILVGAPDGDSYAGESYVLFGKASGFASAINLATLDGTNGFRLDGIDAHDHSGSSVSSAGDVNGDGFADILVGAPGGDSYAGESYVVFGKAAGFASAINLATLDGTNGFRLDGIDADDQSGFSVASAGDVNGDGFADVIIGAFGADPGGDGVAGESYVVFGKASGFAANLDLATLDGTNGFRLDGIDPNDRSGRSVASAGDINGDGFDDIIIGASYGDPGGDSNAGESYVVFGLKPDTAVVRIGTAAGQTLAGGDLDDELVGLAGSDQLWGHGGDDELDGGTGNDTMRGGAGDDDFFGGTGSDTAVYQGTWLDYAITGAGTLTIADMRGGSPDGTDTVLSVENFRFANGTFTAAEVVDVAPTDIALSASTIAENSAHATVVGVLSSTDANAAVGDTATFTLLKSAGGRFAISGTSLVVANGKLLDFESGASHQVTVRVTDAKGLAFDEVLTVHLTNVSPETILGTAAANVLRGGSDRDIIHGLGGADTLAGGLGSDTLLGASGFDCLIGGFDRDVMTGGGNRDVFDFNFVGETGKTLATRDVIRDFSHVQSDDIDLSTIDAMTGVFGNQKFAFIGQNAFSGAKGELHYKFAGAATLVEGDVNGDKQADFQIELAGHKVLVGGDFIL